MRNLLIAGAVIAGLYFFTRFRALSALQFVARNVSVSPGGLVLQVGVQNPSSADITINSLFGSVLINGNAIGDISEMLNKVIKGNSETMVPLTIAPNLFGSVALLIQNIQAGGQLPREITFNGSANVDNNVIPLKLSFQ